MWCLGKEPLIYIIIVGQVKKPWRILYTLNTKSFLKAIIIIVLNIIINHLIHSTFGVLGTP